MERGERATAGRLRQHTDLGGHGIIAPDLTGGRKMTNTRQILAEMLTENTGRHMLDSGGAYGRNWERNQGRDFDSEPATVLEFGPDGPEMTHNVYHWLLGRVEYDDKLDKKFHRFAARDDQQDESWLANVENWLHRYAENGRIGESFGCNTYNGEDMLSQVLQYTAFELDNGCGFDPHVILQIHGGCDVRGGYTAPRVFRLYGELYDMLDNARGHIACDSCDANWYTDDSYHWYYDGGCNCDRDRLTGENCPECGGKLMGSS